jgi:hypothetical protein
MFRTAEQLWFKKGQEMLPFSKAAVCFPVRWVAVSSGLVYKAGADFHPLLWLRMCGTIPPFINMPSWHGA